MFKRLASAVLKTRLQKIAAGEGFTLTEDAAEKLALLADGSMRDAISLLDQCASDDVVDMECVQNTIGLAGPQELMNLIEAVAMRNISSSFDILNNLYNDGRDMTSLLNEMALLVRDLLVFKLSPDSGLLNAGFDRKTLTSLSDELVPERLYFLLDILKSAIAGLSRSGSSKLSVEMCLIKMCDERLSDDASALLARITRLESGVTDIRDDSLKSGVMDKSIQTAAPLKHTETKTPENLTPPVEDTIDNNNDGSDAVDSGDNGDDAVDSGNFHVNDNIAENNANVSINSTDAQVSEADNIYAHEDDINNTDTQASEMSSTDSQISDIDNTGTQAGEDDADDFWTEILEHLNNEPSVHVLLSDRSKVKAQLDSGSIVITVADAFTAELIKTEFSELIKDAAFNVLGRSIVIHIEVGNIDQEEGQRSKLDSLNAFGIVKFD